MKQKKYIICATAYDFVMGGVPTYFIRMLEWANQNDFGCGLLLQKNRFIDPIWKAELAKKSIDIIYYNISTVGKINILNKKDFFRNNEKKIIICSDLHCYVGLQNLEYKYPHNTSVLFYCLHPHATIIEKRKLLNCPYRVFLKEHLNNGVMFMDKETWAFFSTYYKLKEKTEKYYRVGEFIGKLETARIIENAEKRKKKFEILTISRMEIPFKGYLLGLIEEFAKLAEKNEALHLTIVGDGPDRNLIEEKLAELPLFIRKRINEVGLIPYDQLDGYYENANLYVGMGSTLIEASKKGVPCIVATAFQTKSLSAGFFDDEYDNIGGKIFHLDHPGVRFGELIQKTLEYNDHQYIERCLKAYDTVSKLYNIDVIMKEILDLASSKKLVKPSKLLLIYNGIIFRIKVKVQIHKRKKKNET